MHLSRRLLFLELKLDRNFVCIIYFNKYILLTHITWLYYKNEEFACIVPFLYEKAFLYYCACNIEFVLSILFVL